MKVRESSFPGAACVLLLTAVACGGTGAEAEDPGATADAPPAAAASEDASDGVPKVDSKQADDEERPGEIHQTLASPGFWVTNVRVTAGSSGVACPAGYDKISGDLNAGARGKYIYLCVSHDPSKAGYYDSWPLGRLVGRASFQNQIIVPQRGTYDPKSDYCEIYDPNYGCLKSNVAAYADSNGDLNQDAGGWYEFLSKTMFVPLSGPYARLLDIQVSLTASCPSPAYNQAAEQPGFEPAVFYIPADAGGGSTKDANYKAGGKYVYICQYLYPFWPS